MYATRSQQGQEQCKRVLFISINSMPKLSSAYSLLSFHTSYNGCVEKFSNLSKVTQLVNDEASILMEPLIYSGPPDEIGHVIYWVIAIASPITNKRWIRNTPLSHNSGQCPPGAWRCPKMATPVRSLASCLNRSCPVSPS